MQDTERPRGMMALIIFLRRYPRLFDLLNRTARRLGRRSVAYEAISRHLPQGRPFTYMQIGANDGISHDPFREFMIRPEARGVAVEPVPEYFEAMVRNYAAYPQVEVENCAIGYPSGTLPIYTYSPGYLAKHGGSAELAGLAGFNRDHLLPRLGAGDDPSQCIRALEIPVRTAEEVLAKHGLSTVDCLFLDCEGHERNILKNLDYEKLRPRLIVYETTHLGDEAGGIANHLKSHGFALEPLEFDMIASKGAATAGA